MFERRAHAIEGLTPETDQWLRRVALEMAAVVVRARASIGCNRIMVWPRMVWLALAAATAVWGGAFVAAEPLYQISSCEVVNMDDACGESVLTHYGAELVVLLAAPVLLCVVPAIPVFRRSSWLVASAVLLVAFLALPATDSVFGVLIYFLPVGVLALLVAGFQRWYERRQGAAGV